METLRGRAAITGLGITEMGRIYGHDATYFAGEAIRLAVEDAGLTKHDIDGLLINAGAGQNGALSLGLAPVLGFEKLRVLNHMNGAGSTPAQMLTYASTCVAQGLANHVVCVFADAPLQAPGGSAAATHNTRWRRDGTWRCTAQRTIISAPSR
jgi:acetyl-CoA acetyltransferase